MTVIGRTHDEGPTCRLGRYRARDGSAGGRVDLDLDRPHVALVVGKRGSGKSYTLGVLAEALARRDGVAPVVADPMGGFDTLTDGGAVPASSVEPAVPADALDPRTWCRLLELDPAGGPGALVWRAADSSETLTEMVAAVEAADAPDSDCLSARNHLALAAEWGVFGGRIGPGESGAATVLDLAGVGRAPASAVVAAVASRLYDRRIAGTLDRLPWLLLDEAHVAFEGVAARALRRLVTRGRQPGVSLVAATQRPSALPAVAVSQSDLLVVHRLTSRADLDALSAARPTYFGGDIASRVPTEPGEALVVDDVTESVHEVRVRERVTPHGGESPRASKSKRRW